MFALLSQTLHPQVLRIVIIWTSVIPYHVHINHCLRATISKKFTANNPHCLDIHWLESILNKALKRLTDIAVALLFIITLLPILIVICTIILKRQKTGPVLTFCEICPNADKKNFEGLVFNDSEQLKKYNLRYAPLAFNLLVGQISLWDLKEFTEIIPHTENVDTEHESISEEIEDDLQVENTISTSQDSLPDAEKDLEDLENAIMTTENEEEDSDGDISENTDDTDEKSSEDTLWCKASRKVQGETRYLQCHWCSS
mgnify:CR=1 FL=1